MAYDYKTRYNNHNHYKKRRVIVGSPVIQNVEVLFGSGLAYSVLLGARKNCPWTVTGIKFTFDQPVTAVASDLTLTKIHIDGSIFSPNVTFPVSSVSGSGTNVLTFTPTTAITLAGIRAHLFGADYDFWVVFGDADGDNKVLSNDGTLVRNMANVGTYYLFYDINGDGVVDTTDFNIIRGRTGTGIS